MPWNTPEEVVALCTFLPDGETDAISLGVDDCWIETQIEAGRNIYIVHCQYVNRDGSPFFIEGDTRAEAEVYVRTLFADLAVKPLVPMDGPEGAVLYAPKSGALKGKLENPFTDFAESNCYATALVHQDTGGRLYGFDVTFEQPVFPGGGSLGTPDFTFNSVNIGNQPGVLTTNVDTNFARYTVKTRYIGTGQASYLATLANSLGFSQLVTHELPRGAVGNRGLVKSYTASAASLVWVGRATTYTNCWLTSLSGEETDGVLNITAEFVQVR